MMYEEFQQLSKAIEKVESGLQEMHATLNLLLQRNDKSFSVQFKKKKYEFIPSSTQQERLKTYSIRNQFIRSLLKHVINKNLSNTLVKKYGWNDILAFAIGPNPKDFQYEKISLDQLYEITDENGEKIISLPLNQDSTYIKMQNPNS